MKHPIQLELPFGKITVWWSAEELIRAAKDLRDRADSYERQAYVIQLGDGVGGGRLGEGIWGQN